MRAISTVKDCLHWIILPECSYCMTVRPVGDKGAHEGKFGDRDLSALRIDTLRLVWLEAFVAVAETENMSEAAGLLGVSQPSVSRYVQALEAWTGKKLVEAGGVHDPENARVSIALTDEGRDFFDLAQAVLTDLTNFRSPKARYQEARDDAEAIIGKMETDLKNEETEIAQSIRKNIDFF